MEQILLNQLTHLAILCSNIVIKAHPKALPAFTASITQHLADRAPTTLMQLPDVTLAPEKLVLLGSYSYSNGTKHQEVLYSGLYTPHIVQFVITLFLSKINFSPCNQQFTPLTFRLKPFVKLSPKNAYKDRKNQARAKQTKMSSARKQIARMSHSRSEWKSRDQEYQPATDHHGRKCYCCSHVQDSEERSTSNQPRFIKSPRHHPLPTNSPRNRQFQNNIGYEQFFEKPTQPNLGANATSQQKDANMKSQSPLIKFSHYKKPQVAGNKGLLHPKNSDQLDSTTHKAKVFNTKKMQRNTNSPSFYSSQIQNLVKTQRNKNFHNRSAANEDKNFGKNLVKREKYNKSAERGGATTAISFYRKSKKYPKDGNQVFHIHTEFKDEEELNTTELNPLKFPDINSGFCETNSNQTQAIQRYCQLSAPNNELGQFSEKHIGLANKKYQSTKISKKDSLHHHNSHLDILPFKGEIETKTQLITEIVNQKEEKLREHLEIPFKVGQILSHSLNNAEKAPNATNRMKKIPKTQQQEKVKQIHERSKVFIRKRELQSKGKEQNSNPTLNKGITTEIQKQQLSIKLQEKEKQHNEQSYETKRINKAYAEIGRLKGSFETQRKKKISACDIQPCEPTQTAHVAQNGGLSRQSVIFSTASKLIAKGQQTSILSTNLLSIKNPLKVKDHFQPLDEIKRLKQLESEFYKKQPALNGSIQSKILQAEINQQFENIQISAIEGKEHDQSLNMPFESVELDAPFYEDIRTAECQNGFQKAKKSSSSPTNQIHLRQGFQDIKQQANFRENSHTLQRQNCVQAAQSSKNSKEQIDSSATNNVNLQNIIQAIISQNVEPQAREIEWNKNPCGKHAQGQSQTPGYQISSYENQPITQNAFQRKQQQGNSASVVGGKQFSCRQAEWVAQDAAEWVAREAAESVSETARKAKIVRAQAIQSQEDDVGISGQRREEPSNSQSWAGSNQIANAPKQKSSYDPFAQNSKAKQAVEDYPQQLSDGQDLKARASDPKAIEIANQNNPHLCQQNQPIQSLKHRERQPEISQQISASSSQLQTKVQNSAEMVDSFQVEQQQPTNKLQNYSPMQFQENAEPAAKQSVQETEKTHGKCQKLLHDKQTIAQQKPKKKAFIAVEEKKQPYLLPFANRTQKDDQPNGANNFEAELFAAEESTAEQSPLEATLQPKEQHENTKEQNKLQGQDVSLLKPQQEISQNQQQHKSDVIATLPSPIAGLNAQPRGEKMHQPSPVNTHEICSSPSGLQGQSKVNSRSCYKASSVLYSVQKGQHIDSQLAETASPQRTFQSQPPQQQQAAVGAVPVEQGARYESSSMPAALSAAIRSTTQKDLDDTQQQLMDCFRDVSAAQDLLLASQPQCLHEPTPDQLACNRIARKTAEFSQNVSKLAVDINQKQPDCTMPSKFLQNGQKQQQQNKQRYYSVQASLQKQNKQTNLPKQNHGQGGESAQQQFHRTPQNEIELRQGQRLLAAEKHKDHQIITQLHSKTKMPVYYQSLVEDISHGQSKDGFIFGNGDKGLTAGGKNASPQQLPLSQLAQLKKKQQRSNAPAACTKLTQRPNQSIQHPNQSIQRPNQSIQQVNQSIQQINQPIQHPSQPKQPLNKTSQNQDNHTSNNQDRERPALKKQHSQLKQILQQQQAAPHINKLNPNGSKYSSNANPRDLRTVCLQTDEFLQDHQQEAKVLALLFQSKQCLGSQKQKKKSKLVFCEPQFANINSNRSQQSHVALEKRQELAQHREPLPLPFSESLQRFKREAGEAEQPSSVRLEALNKLDQQAAQRSKIIRHEQGHDLQLKQNIEQECELLEESNEDIKEKQKQKERKNQQQSADLPAQSIASTMSKKKSHHAQKQPPSIPIKQEITIDKPQIQPMPEIVGRLQYKIPLIKINPYQIVPASNAQAELIKKSIEYLDSLCANFSSRLTNPRATCICLFINGEWTCFSSPLPHEHFSLTNLVASHLNTQTIFSCLKILSGLPLRNLKDRSRKEDNKKLLKSIKALVEKAELQSKYEAERYALTKFAKEVHEIRRIRYFLDENKCPKTVVECRKMAQNQQQGPSQNCNSPFQNCKSPFQSCNSPFQSCNFQGQAISQFTQLYLPKNAYYFCLPLDRNLTTYELELPNCVLYIPQPYKYVLYEQFSENQYVLVKETSQWLRFKHDKQFGRFLLIIQGGDARRVVVTVGLEGSEALGRTKMSKQEEGSKAKGYERGYENKNSLYLPIQRQIVPKKKEALRK